MQRTSDNPRFKLGLRDTLRILLPYARRNFMDQIQGIWFIVAYLIGFQLLVLQLPLVFAGMIALGILLVATGLMFFMEGLKLGLMPLGEVIGSVLPRATPVPLILLFAFLLGVGATFAEPAIAVLKAAGAGVRPLQAPLLHALLNEHADQLVYSVGVGVGVAVLLGVLRFFHDWPLKYLAIPLVSTVLGLSLYCASIPELSDVLGLAWDCGAVTTGPVTVPLVLALGIGVCRVVSRGSGTHSGFGIVTLASLLPILAVLLLALFHHAGGDYRLATTAEVVAEEPAAKSAPRRSGAPISEQELRSYVTDGELPADFEFSLRGGEARLVDGQLIVQAPEVVIAKPPVAEASVLSDQTWDTAVALGQQLRTATLEALRAIVPLCIFLFVVLRVFLGQRLQHGTDVAIGLTFAFFGMLLFGVGIALGLTPLGGQLGSNVPLAFADVVPWGDGYTHDALFGEQAGKLVAIGFAFFLGYGATLAEPALNALGDTVERITVGAFRKKLLMQSVAIGVGLGIGAGVIKMAYGLPLLSLLVPAYALVIVLTVLSPHSFVNFSWDSAGVTTGPITVPLVLAMGLGIGANVPGVTSGFGILALASVGPILTVLTVGLYTQRRERAAAAGSTQQQTAKPASVAHV